MVLYEMMMIYGYIWDEMVYGFIRDDDDIWLYM